MPHNQTNILRTLTHHKTLAPNQTTHRRSNLRLRNKQAPNAKNPPPAGGKGPLSAEFLTVSGALATIIAFPTITTMTTYAQNMPIILQKPWVRTIAQSTCTFTYGLFLARFDLHKARTLKLTIAFAVICRFVAIPILSHVVAIAGYAFANMLTRTTLPAATAHRMAQNTSAQVKASAKSLSLPAGVLSSLFLLSTTPPVFSPSIALLSQYVHTTLLAILLSLTITLFPLLPNISHAVSAWAHTSALLNFGGTLPKVLPPPPFHELVATTTMPFLAGVVLSRCLPGRWSALAGFLGLPAAWLASLTLVAGAGMQVARGGLVGLPGSLGLCAGVTGMMVLLARLLSSMLLLKGRAKRTLILYLCIQGTVMGAGLAPARYSGAPHVASAIIGLVCIGVMARSWSKVVIRTSGDVM